MYVHIYIHTYATATLYVTALSCEYANGVVASVLEFFYHTSIRIFFVSISFVNIHNLVFVSGMRVHLYASEKCRNKHTHLRCHAM